MKLNEMDIANLTAIEHLLDEAYGHYFKYSDGYHKSREGGISLDLDDYFDRKEGGRNVGVTVVSSVFGRHRSNYFPSSADALHEVRKWHADEMSTTYCPCGAPIWSPVDVEWHKECQGAA